MSIHFLFTKNSKFGSKLIRWGLNEDSSHFAVGFDIGPDNRGVVFHSHFHGLGITWASDFLRKNEVVYTLTPVFQLKLDAEERLYQAVVRNYGVGYDFKGFIYFVFAGIGHRLFGRKIGKTNRWGDKRDLLCTEVAENMRIEIDDIFKIMLPLTRGAMSPDKLYFALKASPLLKAQ